MKGKIERLGDRRLAEKLELIAKDCEDVTDDEIISHAEARAWRSVAKAIRGVIREIDAR